MILQSPVFLVNSRNPLVTATLRGFGCSRKTDPTPGGHTFFRSYGANMPSSLTVVISNALGSSPRPPESVYGTGAERARIEAFLGSMESINPLSPKGPRPPIPQG